MNKTILMLINGFGVERKDSAEVYTHDLMPNFDNLTKTTLFGAINTMGADYDTGYSYFSMPESGAESKFIDDMVYDDSLLKNEILLKIKGSVKENNKLHIFLFVENADILNQLKTMLQALNEPNTMKIFIHLIMTSPNLDSYNEIDKIVSKIAFEYTNYARVGMIVGKNNINNDNVLRIMLRQQGERWLQFSKKIDVLHSDVVSPENAQPFFVHEGFAVTEGDSVLILNYSTLDIDKLYNSLTTYKINTFSLYPFKEGVPHMFDRTKASKYFSSLLEKYGIKVMVLAEKDHVNKINYFLNGNEKKLSDNLTFAINDDILFSNKEAVINLIESTDSNGYILDYDIGSFMNMKDIKDTLHRIDGLIKNLYDAASEKGYTLIISSLYGIHATIRDGVVDKVVNFSGRIPCIYYNKDFDKKNYSINSSTTTGLMLTFLTNIKDEVGMNRLIHKKSALDKIINSKK